MNKLVKYLTEHYQPGGNAYRIARMNDILESTGGTEEEAHRMTMEARREKLLYFTPKTGTGRWNNDALIPGDIEFIAVTRKGIKQASENVQ
mgnify:CR=1 FL=1